MLRVLLFFIALLGNLSANSARQLTGAWAEMKPLYGLQNGKVVGIDAEISRLVFTSAGFKLNFDINDSHVDQLSGEFIIRPSLFKIDDLRIDSAEHKLNGNISVDVSAFKPILSFIIECCGV